MMRIRYVKSFGVQSQLAWGTGLQPESLDADIVVSFVRGLFLVGLCQGEETRSLPLALRFMRRLGHA